MAHPPVSPITATNRLPRQVDGAASTDPAREAGLLSRPNRHERGSAYSTDRARWWRVWPGGGCGAVRVGDAVRTVLGLGWRGSSGNRPPTEFGLEGGG